MNVAVIGLGGVGSAAAYYLARDGHQVTGIEQFQIDHDHGESFGGSRIIRRVYPDVFYTRLMDEAYRLWDALQPEAGEELLVRCGGLFFGPPEQEEMARIVPALVEAAVPFERWDAATVRERFPQFRLDANDVGIYQAETGFLRASRCVRAAARLARSHGAELREGSPVAAIEDAGGAGVRIRLAGGDSLTVDRAIVAAGPWLRSLIGERLSLPIKVTRQLYVHLEPAVGDGRFRVGKFPVWIDFAAPSVYYGFPEHDDAPGAKIACNDLGAVVDPDAVDREVEESYREQLRAYVRRRIPDLSGTVTFEKVCLYDNTPDDDFILDRLPDDPRITVVGGTSGHGFKFVTLLGRLAATMATDGEVAHDIGRFSLGRFG